MEKALYTNVINFNQKGGVSQFCEAFIANCSPYYVAKRVDCYGSLLERMHCLWDIRFANKVIFISNNILVYFYILVARRCEIILIHHDHFLRDKFSIKAILLSVLFRVFSYRFKAVIIHQDSDSHARKLLKSKNIKFLKMPYHGPKHSFELNSRKNEACPKTFLFFGRLEPYKNIDFLVKCFSRTSVRLNIVGSGKVKQASLEVISKSSNITLVNRFVPDDECLEYFLSADYLVLPYKEVTQTGIVDYAGSFGLPCMLSEIEGFSSYSIDSSVVICPLKEDIFLNKLEELAKVSDKKYEEMSVASIARFKQSLNQWTNYIHGVLDD